jgi:hypothetical protein
MICLLQLEMSLLHRVAYAICILHHVQNRPRDTMEYVHMFCLTKMLLPLLPLLLSSAFFVLSDYWQLWNRDPCLGFPIELSLEDVSYPMSSHLFANTRQWEDATMDVSIRSVFLHRVFFEGHDRVCISNALAPMT